MRNYGPLNIDIHYGKTLQDNITSVLLDGTLGHKRMKQRIFKKKVTIEQEMKITHIMFSSSRQSKVLL